MPKVDVTFASDRKANPLVINKKHQTNLSNQIPRVLLFELASLPQNKYKIEIRTKYMSLCLPKNKKLEEDHDDPSDQMETDVSTLTETDHIFAKYSDDYVLLKCSLNNDYMPLVPPIRILVPFDYPNSNPFVELIQISDFDDDMLPEYGM